MTDVTPPRPPSPSDLHRSAKGVLKGHGKWVYIAGAVVLIGVAYFVWRNGQMKDDTANLAGAPDVSTGMDGTPQYGSTGPVGGAYQYSDLAYPAASQGAYGGYDAPVDYAPGPTDSAGNPEGTPPVVVNVEYPGVTAGGGDAVPSSSATAAVTGGGSPPRSVAAHLPPIHLDEHGQDSGLHFITVDRGGVTTRLYETKRGKGDFGSTAKSVVSLGKAAPAALPSFKSVIAKTAPQSPVKPVPTPAKKPAKKKK